MSKYRGSFMSDEGIAAAEKEIADLEAANRGSDPENQTIDDQIKELDESEVKFEKRYGDLRRLTQKKDAEHKEEIKRLKAELGKTETKLPATEAEMEAWFEKFPEVGRIFKTLAIKEAQSIAAEDIRKMSDRIEGLEEKLSSREESDHVAQLKKHHSDWDKIAKSAEFQEWLTERQANDINDWAVVALTKGRNVNTAIEAVDKFKQWYKARTGSGTAAEDIGVTNAATSIPEGKKQWRESEIDRMTPDEFAKHEQEIMAAQREGRIVMDLQG